MSISVPFKVSARTAKLIGLENFSTEEGAVIELVKNTYDADAKNCLIIFDLKESFQDNTGLENINRENSSIYIIDNGIGMCDSIIQNQWMTIGTDKKLHEHTTIGGRVKTGAKGIGRFALNRLGMLTDMTSTPTLLETINSNTTATNGESSTTSFIPNSNNLGFEWTVNWKDFDDKGATVTDVKAILSIKQDLNLKNYLLKRFNSYSKIKDLLNHIDFKSGTVIEISELNDYWNKEKLSKLYNNLEMLLPPNEQNDFRIDLFSLNDLDEFGTIKRAYYDDYDYKLEAIYNQKNDKTLNIKISRSELDIKALENTYFEVFNFDTMKKSPYTLSDFKKETINFNLHINKLISDKINQDLLERVGKFNFTFYFLKNTISDDKEEGDEKKYPYKPFDTANRKSWLKKFGGIKIFRDDFRIRPYGENGDDWLRLGERQAKSPGGAGQRLGGYRIRPNQIAGTVKISRLHNENFQDKSGREGIIENDEFELFKNILLEIISIFEKDRNTVMYNLSELYKKNNREAEKLRRAKEEAKKIKDQKKQREKGKANFENKNEVNNSSEVDNIHSKNEENMADAILILEKDNEKKDDELRLLRSLASVGLIISSFAHEVKSLRSRLIPRGEQFLRELKKYLKEEDFANLDPDDNPYYMVRLMQEEDVKLKHWLDYSLSTLKRDKRERKNLYFNDYFDRFKSTWTKALQQRKITLNLQKDKENKSLIRAFEVDMDSIFNNLLSNSINALNGLNKDKKEISISWRKIGNQIEVVFKDNGRGLDQMYQENPNEIFNLNESSRKDRIGNKIGTGLGLYIVKTIIQDHNGSSISVMKVDTGFQVKINFKTRQ